MSIFSSIASAEHTFVAWVEKEWGKFVAEAPKIEEIALQGFKYATTALNIVLQKVGPTTEAGKVISEAIKDILTISSVVYDAGPAPTIAGLIQDVVSNLQGVLTAGHISDTGLVATITKVVSTISALAAAFLVPAAV